jgi:TetR/AcrR family transcriptional repressor of lmrAB and yxaGH operons
VKKGEISRNKMIAATAELLQRQGYHGTGLKQILEHSDAPKGSLYFHFPGGKEELACAALVQSGETLRLRIAEAIDGAPDLGAAIVAVTELLADELEQSDFDKGCPVATVALEAAGASELVRQTCEDSYRGWQALIEQQLETSGLPAPLAAQAAMFALSAIEGALLLSRVYRDVSPLRAVGAQMTMALKLLGRG